MKARSSAFRRLRTGVGVGMVTAAAFGVGAVAAQTGYGDGQSSAYRGRGNGNVSSGGTTYALSVVVAKMSGAAGVQILADHAVASDTVTAPNATTTAANVDAQIKALVAQLPNGTVSGKFYLPASAKGAGYTAEAVEAFAMAEARLFGPVGGADTQTSGAVEVLGQTLSANKASAVVSDLNLQPVYLIGNPNGGVNGNGPYAQNGNYNNPTGANNASSVSQQAQTLMGMSATERNQALTQMLNQNQQNQQVISQVMQGMSATDRQQLMQSMGGVGGGGFGGGGRGGFGGSPGGPGGGPGGPR